MVARAYQLAAKALAEEVGNSMSTANAHNISNMAIATERCLQELQGLQSTLISYPVTEWCGDNVKFSFDLQDQSLKDE